MQCMSKDIMLDMLDYIRHQAEFIIETTEDVKELNDFLCSQSGMVLYNSTCMCLQTIGETVRKIDELTDRKFLDKCYPEVPWRSIIGMRNIISHEYAATDPEKVFNTIKLDIPALLQKVDMIIEDVSAGKHNDKLENNV
ncbi:MAG TPA: DUF86 domain-containing protein [Candidatus Onthomorpha intestinigallinarum]|uniref:DUF86 domain-containing protein n=1 Tax=Candidatus Onthomorpha intestinigallinarum TaxID=2840880 RepID=A0A9D1RGI1_9BACT|nr:DUF86 domain-containing protein [Candidatus Onthomorpha intestinigallinarum]